MKEILHRVSIRKYEDRPVEKETILQILRAGMQAPSAGNQQPWEFYVVTDKAKIQMLSKAHQYAGCADGIKTIYDLIEASGNGGWYIPIKGIGPKTAQDILNKADRLFTRSGALDKD